MPYGKKSRKRGNRRRSNARKSSGKRGLSKIERAQVRNIVHGQSEMFNKTFEGEDQALLMAGTGPDATGLSTVRYNPTIIRLGGISIAQGDNRNDRSGNEVNMRSINVRLFFNLAIPDYENMPNLEGPRRVLWWVVSLKNRNTARHSNIYTGSELGGDASDFPLFPTAGSDDFESFFFDGERNVRGFSGGKFDELDPINTDVWTKHSSGKFDIGYSQNPNSSFGAGAPSPSKFLQDYGKVAYRKDLRVPVPKFMLGKTRFQQEAYSDTTSVDRTDKVCYFICTSIPLTQHPNVYSEASGIVYDHRIQYRYTDM